MEIFFQGFAFEILFFSPVRTKLVFWVSLLKIPVFLTSSLVPDVFHRVLFFILIVSSFFLFSLLLFSIFLHPSLNICLRPSVIFHLWYFCSSIFLLRSLRFGVCFSREWWGIYVVASFSMYFLHFFFDEIGSLVSKILVPFLIASSLFFSLFLYSFSFFFSF